MNCVAEMLAAIVVGLAAAVVSWFGLALDSSSSDRTVRRLPASVTAEQTITPRTEHEAPIPC